MSHGPRKIEAAIAFATEFQRRTGLAQDGWPGALTFGELDERIPAPAAPPEGFSLNQSSRDKLAKVDARLRQIVMLAASYSPIPFIVTQGLRTEAEQRALYAQGRTTPGKIVTWTLASNHMKGMAVDLAPVDNLGAIDWNDLDAFKALAEPMKRAARELGYGMDWGGDWTRNKDYPHYELKG